MCCCVIGALIGRTIADRKYEMQLAKIQRAIQTTTTAVHPDGPVDDRVTYGLLGQNKEGCHYTGKSLA